MLMLPSRTLKGLHTFKRVLYEIVETRSPDKNGLYRPFKNYYAKGTINGKEEHIWNCKILLRVDRVNWKNW